jgi:hypothetical protein
LASMFSLLSPKGHRLTQNISLIMCWPNWIASCYICGCYSKTNICHPYGQFAHTRVKSRHSKNWINTGHNHSSSGLLTGSCSIRLLSFWIYQVKDRLSRISVCKWLAWVDKRGIWPSFEVRPWKCVWRMTGSSSDLYRLWGFLFPRGLSNGIFLFDNLIKPRDATHVSGHSVARSTTRSKQN